MFAHRPHGSLCRFPAIRFRIPSWYRVFLAIVRLYTMDKLTWHTYSVVLSRIAPFIAPYISLASCPVKGLGGRCPIKGFVLRLSVCRGYIYAYVKVRLVFTSRGRRRLWSIPWAAADMCVRRCLTPLCRMSWCRGRVSWPLGMIQVYTQSRQRARGILHFSYMWYL